MACPSALSSRNVVDFGVMIESYIVVRVVDSSEGSASETVRSGQPDCLAPGCNFVGGLGQNRISRVASDGEILDLLGGVLVASTPEHTCSPCLLQLNPPDAINTMCQFCRIPEFSTPVPTSTLPATHLLTKLQQQIAFCDSLQLVIPLQQSRWQVEYPRSNHHELIHGRLVRDIAMVRKIIRSRGVYTLSTCEQKMNNRSHWTASRGQGGILRYSGLWGLYSESGFRYPRARDRNAGSMGS
jgi:hypothetical protein